MPGAQTEAQRQATFAAAGQQPAPTPTQYTTKQVGTNYEVYDGVNRVGTGTKQFADSYLAKNAAVTTAANNNAGTPAYTPYVSDSSSVVAGENNTMSSLSTMFGQTPDIKMLMDNSAKSMAEIEKYQSALEKRRADEEARITAQYEGEKAQQADDQKRETGATNVALTTRLGGYLGASGSATGAMNNLAASHRTEMLALDAKRDAAIQAARNAISDKEFALAQLKSQEIKSLTDDIYQRQQDFFNNAIKLQSENRENLQFQSSQIKDKLDMLSKVASVSEEIDLDPMDAATIDRYYGVQGFAKQYFQAARTAAVAKTTQEKAEAMKNYVDLIQSVPAGKQITFGDDTITGIGSVDDISTFQVQDQYGNVRVVNYNKGSGAYAVTNLGAIGNPENGGGDTESGVKVSVQKAISAYQQYFVPGRKTPGGVAVLDVNNYVNPKAFKELMDGARTYQNVPREEFIRHFGNLMYTDDRGLPDKEYGLTPVEKKIVTGELE